MAEPQRHAQDGQTPSLPLAGIRVLDLATIIAGPAVATMLADFGAEVIKVEHPKGDPQRRHGYMKDGVGLWWKVLNRNKQCITLNLSTPEGQDLFRQMIRDVDVVVENFRPGTLERWNLAPEHLLELNPGLVVLRMTGFGQFGPYARRAGFGTLAESMSGFAHVTGQPDGPPTLPPMALADNIAGLAGANAVMFALYHRDVHGGAGQVIDIALIEPILAAVGPHVTNYDQLGIVPQRTGNRSAANAPRNTYRTRDDRWVAISTSAQSIAERVMRLVGRPDTIDESWFQSGEQRAQHADELDAAVGGWIAERDLDVVIREFEAVDAAVAPVYDITDIIADPQYQALDTIIDVPDDDFGTVKMTNVQFRMSGTPGEVRHSGRGLGQDNAEVYAALGLDAAQVEQLREKGVV